jgi:hypothetical protein
VELQLCQRRFPYDFGGCLRRGGQQLRVDRASERRQSNTPRATGKADELGDSEWTKRSAWADAHAPADAHEAARDGNSDAPSFCIAYSDADADASPDPDQHLYPDPSRDAYADANVASPDPDQNADGDPHANRHRDGHADADPVGP